MEVPLFNPRTLISSGKVFALHDQTEPIMWVGGELLANGSDISRWKQGYDQICLFVHSSMTLSVQ